MPLFRILTANSRAFPNIIYRVILFFSRYSLALVSQEKEKTFSKKSVSVTHTQRLRCPCVLERQIDDILKYYLSSLLYLYLYLYLLLYLLLYLFLFLLLPLLNGILSLSCRHPVSTVLISPYAPNAFRAFVTHRRGDHWSSAVAKNFVLADEGCSPIQKGGTEIPYLLIFSFPWEHPS